MYALRHRGQYDQAVASELDAMLAAIRAWLTVDHNEDGTHDLRPSGFDFVPIGAWVMWGTATPPTGWLICDGTAISRTSYQALFELWGTTYGVGDGSTTFNLPDMRQRFPLGKAASGTGDTLGATGGTIDHTHSVSFTSSSAGGHSHTVDNHSHSIAEEGNHTHSLAVGNNVGLGADTWRLDSTDTGSGGAHDHGASTGTTNPGTSSASDHTHTVSGNTGNGNPPYLVVHFIVLTGVA